jgi:tRNA (uracil-5-)-methyltransferase
MLKRAYRALTTVLQGQRITKGTTLASGIMSRSPSPPHKRVKIDVAVEQAPVQALSMPVAEVAQPIAETTAGPSKPKQSKGTTRKQKKAKRPPMPEACSPDDVLHHDIRDFLGPELVDAALAAQDSREWDVPASIIQGEIMELRVGAFTVAGDSLSRVPPAKEGDDVPLWAVVTPFAHPGDLIKARVYRSGRLHSYADLIEVVQANMEFRGGEGDRENGGTKGCKYFGVWYV